MQCEGHQEISAATVRVVSDESVTMLMSSCSKLDVDWTVNDNNNDDYNITDKGGKDTATDSSCCSAGSGGHQADVDDDEFDDFFDGDVDINELGFPRGKRLAPVGANDEDNLKEQFGRSSFPDHTKMMMMSSNGGSVGSSPCMAESAEQAEVLQQRIREMEEDQEELNNSLMALTSHFAKVQLRLQQVVTAPADKREELLKELEHFAFRGIPNINSPRMPDSQMSKNNQNDQEQDHHNNDHEYSQSTELINNEILEAQKKKHTELIYQLKGQLEELESYAYESGEGEVPSTLLLERQRVVMEQLRTRLNLRVDNIEKLTAEELRAEVDSAVGQLVNPLKMKSQLVNQLQTQIQDLEMFIQFLQGESSTMIPLECQDCGCSKHNSPTNSSGGKGGAGGHKKAAASAKKVPRYLTRTKSEQEQIRQQTVSLLQRAMAVLQLTTLAQFGCGTEHFYKNTLKNTPKGNHYGDLRARLELAVDHVIEACSEVECMTDTDCTSVMSESDSQPEYLMSSPRVASIVRKELAMAIRDLMQHGLVTAGSRTSLMPLMGCMSARNAAASSQNGSAGSKGQPSHAWSIILRYYDMKQGREYNSAPARKLSQSFGLDLTGSSSNTKQSFLAAVGQILASHAPYKRSNDAQFKAFVCAGLNQRKLIPWLRLVLRNQSILESLYAPWSYLVKTGFDDAFRCIERLSIYAFNLPINVAVKQFQDMNEAF